MCLTWLQGVKGSKARYSDYFDPPSSIHKPATGKDRMKKKVRYADDEEQDDEL